MDANALKPLTYLICFAFHLIDESAAFIKQEIADRYFYFFKTLNARKIINMENIKAINNLSLIHI